MTVKELADGGILFLDEIAEMDLGLQAKLLRVLQERELQRLGSSETIKLNVRVIAASNVNLLERVRQQKPVVHHLTNWVTIYDCAQVVKTLGASPVMAHAPQEVAEMAQIASALVLNIGTLTVDFVEAMKLAARSANKKGIPVVLDRPGVGANLHDHLQLRMIYKVTGITTPPTVSKTVVASTSTPGSTCR